MELEYNGKPLEYRIERKKMKHIRVRVKTDGIIHVSAPHSAPESEIFNFLLAHAAELAELTERANAQRRQTQDFSDHSRHHWLGGSITLQWHPTPRPTALVDGELCLYARSEEEAYHACRQWMITECTALYTRLNREVYTAFRNAGYTVPYARIQIKEMTTRWGSCTADSGRISMNFRLMQYPLECIRSVFCHEYAHFLHQNHSRAFYTVLLSVCPDYEEWDAILKKPLMSMDSGTR